MSARILVVDDLYPNRKLMEARLGADYFEVASAEDGPRALAMAKASAFDTILLDVMMPGMDGFEVCRRLKADPATAHVPVVMVTALDQPADRVRGLDAGADDFLTKPVNDMALIARIRSLARLKISFDELRARAATATSLGIADPFRGMLDDDGNGGRILLVEDRPNWATRTREVLEARHRVDIQPDANEALIRAGSGEFDLFIVSLGLETYDSLRLCSQLRMIDRIRHTPMLVLGEPEDHPRILRGLELGVNDYLIRPLDRNELVARTRTQVKRKRYHDALRSNLQASIDLAVVDPLTGLHNRRYFDGHLASLLKDDRRDPRPVSLLVLDIDHFKAVNDTFGHQVGDDVLRGMASRVKNVIRPIDSMCRLGGEEFAVVMPDTPLAEAEGAAERIRAAVEGAAFHTSAHRDLSITVSIGLAQGLDSPTDLVCRADRALYRSKADGRNKVTAEAA